MELGPTVISFNCRQPEHVPASLSVSNNSSGTSIYHFVLLLISKHAIQSFVLVASQVQWTGETALQ